MTSSAREVGIAVATARDVRERYLRVAAPHKTPVLNHLRADPSLRFTELGRTLLRLLDVHSRDTDEWDRLAAAVPAHCADSVAEATRACADAWQYFARQVTRPDRGAR